MSYLVKTTHKYATHGIPLECDVYSSVQYPATNPVLLFFHSGGLVGGSRLCVPPWLVQTCMKNKWPLVSASYRLVPQVQGADLLDDAKAAYTFARRLGEEGQERSVIVSGASAGCSLATMIAHNLEPAPLALLSITGIPTFHHPFFTSSIRISSEPLVENRLQHLGRGVTVGLTYPDNPAIFFLDSLLPSGARNPNFSRPSTVEGTNPAADLNGLSYEYLVHRNEFPSILGDVDAGFEWAAEAANAERLARWPMTIFIQGDKDTGVHKEVCQDTAERLGQRAKLFWARDQDHLFERSSFIEDGGAEMDAVRLAVSALEEAVATALGQALKS